MHAFFSIILKVENESKVYCLIYLSHFGAKCLLSSTGDVLFVEQYSCLIGGLF